jgi:hypothetical protein
VHKPYWLRYQYKSYQVPMLDDVQHSSMESCIFLYKWSICMRIKFNVFLDVCLVLNILGCWIKVVVMVHWWRIDHSIMFICWSATFNERFWYVWWLKFSIGVRELNNRDHFLFDKSTYGIRYLCMSVNPSDVGLVLYDGKIKNN